MDELHKIASLPVFTIGGVQSTLGILLSAFIVVIATILIAQLVKKSVHRALKKLDDKEAHLTRIFGIVTQLGHRVAIGGGHRGRTCATT